MTRSEQPYAGSGPDSAELLRLHAPLVKRIAYHLLARLSEQVQVDDLIQAGLEGLLEAASNYQPGKGASFETYAGIRIRGAMLDEVRRGDWSPRSVHRNARAMADNYSRLETQLGRAPTIAEQAEALGLSIEEFSTNSRNVLGVRLQSIDETLGAAGVERVETIADTESNPEQLMEKASLQKRLTDAIAELPERDQLLLSLYYREELNLKEIGEVLGVSESRVSQLHSQAAIKLRAKLIEN